MGDPPASAGSSKEMTGDPPASAGSSKEMTGDPPASAGSSKEMTGDPPAVEMCAVDEEDRLVDFEVFDTKTGDILEPTMVVAARSEETRYMDEIGIFEDATDEECLANTGSRLLTQSGWTSTKVLARIP